MYGIKIKSHKISESFSIENKKEYFYYFYNLKKNDTKKILFNNLSTIYIVDLKNGNNIKINSKKFKIKKNSSIRVRSLKTIEACKNDIKLFVAGIKIKKKIINFKLQQFFKHYNVQKPWGKNFGLIIRLMDIRLKNNYKKGFQTSLQFHIKKRKQIFFSMDQHYYITQIQEQKIIVKILDFIKKN